MNIKRNIIFAPEVRTKNGISILDNVPIRMRVTYKGQRVEFTTGYRIDVAKWDAEKQRVRNGCSNKLRQTAAQINTDLSAYDAQLQGIFKQFEVQGVVPRSEELKEAFAACHQNEEAVALPCQTSHETFVGAFDAFILECGTNNHWTHATRDKFMALRKHLLDFNTEVSFETFDEVGLNAFLGYLQKEKQMRNTTLGKQVGFIKWFLRWTSQKGYPTNEAFVSFRPKLKSTPKKVIFLTREELTRLHDYVIPESKQYLERVRDLFLFCCYTGLRYSDMYNLRRSNVRENRIELTTVKTADSLTIELNKYSKAIIDKYREVPFEHEKVLPVISNQKMNDYLKELSELAGIDEPIRETYYRGNERIDEVFPKYALLGTHAGRRTFICNALSLGIPPQVVMKWTGHSDYKAMKPYIDIADETKVSAMNKFNEL